MDIGGLVDILSSFRARLNFGLLSTTLNGKMFAAIYEKLGAAGITASVAVLIFALYYFRTQLFGKVAKDKAGNENEKTELNDTIVANKYIQGGSYKIKSEGGTNIAIDTTGTAGKVSNLICRNVALEGASKDALNLAYRGNSAADVQGIVKTALRQRSQGASQEQQENAVDEESTSPLID